MTQPDDIVAALRDRETATEELIPEPGHHYVATSLRTAAYAYGACGQIVTSIQRALRTQKLTTITPAALKKAFPSTAADLIGILEGADDLANARDKQVAKKVGWAVLKGVATWGSKVLPVRFSDLKDFAELLSAVGDVVTIGAAARERRHQAKAAVGFLRWSQGIALVAMAWAAEALRILDQLQGKPRRSLQDRVEEVQQRMRVEPAIRPLFRS